MSPRLRLWRDRGGAAAAEMALVAPLILVLLFGSAELGNYFYDEHKLVKAVRDGARYAARQNFSNYTPCVPGDEVPTRDTAGTVFENTELMVRKGSLDSSAADLLPKWDDATFDATIVTCNNSVDSGAGGSLPLGGIYADTDAPTVVVSVSLPYQSVLGTAFGFSGLGLTLNATQSAAVMGL